MTERPLPPNPRLVPEHAKRVFEGIIFDVYQWEQEQFDGSVTTFEMLKRPDTVSVFAIDGDKIIALDEEQPDGAVRHDSIPGGRVNNGEDILDAAKRELLEETGLEFKDWTLLQVTQPASKVEWFRYIYVAQNKTTEHPVSHDPGERITVKRLSYKELKDKNQASFKRVTAFDECDTLEEFLSGLPEMK